MNNEKTHIPPSGPGDCSARSECECATWCDLDIRIRMLTGHHENCKHGGSVLGAALALIDELAKGMESWAHDEDGIHPAAWESYRKAKALVGVYLPPAEHWEPQPVPNNDQVEFQEGSE